MSTPRVRFLTLLTVILLACASGMFAQPVPQPQETFPLHTGWQLQSSCKTQATGAQISSSDFQATGWHAASVPTTVLAALITDGVYQNPDYGTNLRKIPGTDYPIGANFANMMMPLHSPFACAWWYRTEFTVPKSYDGRTIWLHFNGINYRANIWINGKRFANSSEVIGTYRIYNFNVTKFLVPGKRNVLAVKVHAPTPTDLGMNWVDWSPMPPDKNMGLWGSAYLDTSGPVALRHLMVSTRFVDGNLAQANLTVVAQATNASSQPVDADVEGMIGEIHFRQDVELQPGQSRTVTFVEKSYPQLHIVDPKVWWPYGLGPQNLETLTMTASVDGKISDQKSTPFGIREITSSLDSHHYILFRINGKPILIRGGGWTPDMLLRRSPRKLKAEFDYVRQLGLNTIRLEGKVNVSNEFFRLADQRGVLVMAGWCCCSFWERWHRWTPRDLAIAKAQLRSQILRLRSHPSMLVWLNGSDNPPTPKVESAYLQVERKYDWPNPTLSSASQQQTTITGYSGVKMTGPYQYVSPSYWLTEPGKRGGAWGFNTETSPGPAPMVPGSLRKIMPADDIWPQNQDWHFHAGGGAFRTLTVFDNAMDQIYGKPDSLEQYEARAQAMTYEGERAMFEAYARNEFTSTGVVQWMLNNSWPSLYWHLFDYYLQPAGGYFGARKANQMLHVQYSYDNRSVVVLNRYYRTVPGLTVTAQVYDFHLKQIFSRHAEVNAAENSSQSVFTLPPFPKTQTPQVYFVRLRLQDHEGKTISRNFYWISNKPAVFDWAKANYTRTEETSYQDCQQLEQLPQVKLQATASRETVQGNTAVSVRLRNPSAHLAFQIRLAVMDKNGEEVLPVFWNDNYIELMPGEVRTLTAQYPSATNPGAGAELEVSGWNIAATKIPLAPLAGASTAAAH